MESDGSKPLTDFSDRLPARPNETLVSTPSEPALDV